MGPHTGQTEGPATRPWAITLTFLYFRTSHNHCIFLSNFLLIDDQNRLSNSFFNKVSDGKLFLFIVTNDGIMIFAFILIKWRRNVDQHKSTEMGPESKPGILCIYQHQGRGRGAFENHFTDLKKRKWGKSHVSDLLQETKYFKEHAGISVACRTFFWG